ncbi:CU044_2847 family protein [Kitasatospora sp. NPDC001664]
MSDYLEFTFDDGSAVLLRTFPVTSAAPAEPAPANLPPGLGGGTPVGRRAEELGERLTALGEGALRTALSPLVPLLQQVHDTVASVPSRPHEVSVEFGVQLGADLKLGVVGGSAEASLTVSATWQLAPRAAAAEPGAAG